jgi:peptidyl-tRNA hydrolase, PTH1 family
MKLIVGLGNPGGEYARTRHNVGWLVLDELARRHAGSWRSQGKSEVCEVRLGGQKVLLVKPQTFMNDSGAAVAPLVQFFKLDLDGLLVVQDDLDSPFGLLRLRLGGRHGGQNGVRDLISRLGSERFARLKLGISRPPPGWEVVGWVLSKWREDEQPTLAQLVTLAAQAAEAWAGQGLQEAQGRYNSTDLRPKPPEPVPGVSAAGAPAPAETGPAGPES